MIFETYMTNKQMHMPMRIHVSHSNREFMVVLLSTNGYFLKFEQVPVTVSLPPPVDITTVTHAHILLLVIRYPGFSTNLFFLCL